MWLGWKNTTLPSNPRTPPKYVSRVSTPPTALGMMHPTLLILACLVAVELLQRAVRSRILVSQGGLSVVVGVVATHPHALRCIASAFRFKHPSTALHVVVTSYLPLRELPPNLCAHRQHITVLERSLPSPDSELADRERCRRMSLCRQGHIFLEVDQLCVFGEGWDARVQADVRESPPGAVLSTMPSREFEPTFAAVHTKRGSSVVVPRRMDHEPPLPVPSLLWCSAFAVSASPWDASLDSVSSRASAHQAAQTRDLLAQGRALLSPRRCPVRFVQKPPALAFEVPLDVAGKLERRFDPSSVDALARGGLGLTPGASPSELIAKFGTEQVALTKLALLQRRLRDATRV